MPKTYIAPAKDQTLFFITLKFRLFYVSKFREWCFLGFSPMFLIL
jgi:hypothetical protein